MAEPGLVGRRFRCAAAGRGRLGSAVWLLMCDLPLCPWGWESVHGRPARVRGRLWGVCGKRRLWRFGARGDGPFARALPPGSVVGHRRRSGRAARRLRCGTWARQGRRVTTTADCLSLLGLDHTDGGPEVKRRTERPLPKATHSRQVASGRRALGAYSCDARRSAPRMIGAGRADGAVARLTGPDGLRSTAPLISLVPPAPGPDGFRRAAGRAVPRGRFGPRGRSAMRPDPLPAGARDFTGDSSGRK